MHAPWLQSSSLSRGNAGTGAEWVPCRLFQAAIQREPNILSCGGERDEYRTAVAVVARICDFKPFPGTTQISDAFE